MSDFNVFAHVCAVIFGPGQWQTEAVRYLGISRSSVVRYAAGERAVPRALYDRLGKLIDRRIAELERERPKVAKAGHGQREDK